jgi:hypothetical protein
VGLRFNPPPGWPPAPEGFVPPPGWQPDPAWPPLPAGWPLWVSDGTAPADIMPDPHGMVDSSAPGGSAPTAWVPPTQTPLAWSPPGQIPPGQTPPGQIPPGQIPPGQIPPGHASPSAAPPGQLPPAPPAQMPWGYPAYDYAARPAPDSGTNGFAIASFILGLLGLFMVSIILSVVFGIVALTQIRNRPQRGKGLAIAGLALSGAWVLGLVALIAIGIASQAPRSASTGQITGQGSVDIFSLRVGDCFQNPSASDTLLGVTYVTAVPCTTPHNAQVFAEFHTTGGADYPGNASLAKQSDVGCRARIGGNLEQPKVTDTMGLHYLFPLAQAWADGHRTITCLIIDSTPDLTSSLLKPHFTG